jgi:hypothetical protein
LYDPGQLGGAAAVPVLQEGAYTVQARADDLVKPLAPLDLDQGAYGRYRAAGARYMAGGGLAELVRGSPELQQDRPERLR